MSKWDEYRNKIQKIRQNLRSINANKEYNKTEYKKVRKTHHNEYDQLLLTDCLPCDLQKLLLQYSGFECCNECEHFFPFELICLCCYPQITTYPNQSPPPFREHPTPAHGMQIDFIGPAVWDGINLCFTHPVDQNIALYLCSRLTDKSQHNGKNIAFVVPDLLSQTFQHIVFWISCIYNEKTLLHWYATETCHVNDKLIRQCRDNISIDWQQDPMLSNLTYGIQDCVQATHFYCRLPKN